MIVSSYQLLCCGAFKNPPEHVASLFKSVILKYAGFFQIIYFAVVDDHNTGNKINPHGNFLPFQQILDGLIIQPSEKIIINLARGSNRVLNKSTDGQVTLSDVYIFNRSSCYHGAKCNDLNNLQHDNSYSHPSMCPHSGTTASCDQINDEVHTYCFVHNTKCKYGGECDNIDPKHLSEFDHPEFCKDENYCNDTRPEHMFAYRHLPLCRDALKCSKYLKKEQNHCKLFRHCKSICPYDNCCVHFHDKDHLDNTIHSFRTPCPFTPYNCPMYVEYLQKPDGKEVSREVEYHCLQHSHVCPFGRQCRDTTENHLETSIHIARKLCSAGDQCSKLDQEDHLEAFSHSTIRDIRLFCKFPGYQCRDRLDDRHLKRFRHGRNHNHVGVARFCGFNTSIDFVHNQGRLIHTVNNHVKASNWKQAKPAEEILHWIRALQPVHRCRKDIFESILVHGHVMSRHYMKLLEKPKNVTHAVQQHSQVRQIFLRYDNPALKDHACALIDALVEAEFAKHASKAPVASGTARVAPASKTQPSDFEHRINLLERKLKPPLLDRDIATIHRCATKIAQASIKLHFTPMGIGYDADQKLGTDKHIFSILGPHLGHYYGEIFIIFKQEIMLHPDANFSIQAATSFASASTYTHRPWLKDPGNLDKRISYFHTSKLHCSVPLYEYAAAAELIALTGLNKQSMDVNLNAVIQRWINVDSHEVFESHLPHLIPLDYIDKVYMPKNLFESFAPHAQKLAQSAFGDSLILTNHLIDLSLPKSGLDPTRIPYEKFVQDEIHQKIKEMTTMPRITRGTVITVAASKFEDHVVLPITISQSYSLYCLNRTQPNDSSEFTYIYWQAMHGDMMLTISNGKIDPGKDQPNLRCLICYVAEEPLLASDAYHEAYSYLNDGHPYQHDTNVRAVQFKAKSNTFYRGCNTDDFYTFCLKIARKTGQVTLSHAGPNSIYNHEKIEYQFNKTDLDLSRIDFIHVSAGAQDVPIRNLTMNHEQVLEFHPSFDKDFKKDTSALLRKCHGTISYIVPAPISATTAEASVSPHKSANSGPKPQRSSSLDRQSKKKRSSWLVRLKNALFGSSLTLSIRLSSRR